MDEKQNKIIIELPATLRFAYRHAFFHAKKIFPVIKRTGKLRKNKKLRKLLGQYSQERSFLSKRKTDYGFYRFTKKEMKKKWVDTDLKELTHLIFLDIFYPEHSTFRDSRKESEEDRIHKRTTRRVLRDRYPEIFFPAPERKREQIKDGRLRPYSTIFSIAPDRDEYDYFAYQLLSISSSAENYLFEQEINLTSYTVAQLKMAEPEDIIGFRKFWKETNDTIRSLNKAFGPVQVNSWLLQPLKIGSAVPELFYIFIEDAIALRWYRTRKSETRKENILHKNYRINYTQQDAIQAIEENQKWFGNQHQNFDYISRAAYGFHLLNHYETSRMLYEVFLNTLTSNKLVEGLCHRHLAWNYYLTKNPRKYRHELNLALNLFQEIKSRYHAGITWAYLAEANMMNRNKNEAIKSIKTASEIFSDPSLTKKEICRFSRHMADCAHSIKDEEWEIKILDHALDVSSSLEDLSAFLYFNNRLLCLLKNDTSWKINDEMWRVSRNMDFEWEKTNDWYYAPVYSLEVMKEVFDQPV